MRRALVALALVAVGLAATACQGGSPVGRPAVDRVLVVTLPGVTWADVEAGAMPTLAAVAEDAAIGDLSTRIGRRGASTTDAYLSIGAGTRAVAPRVDVAVALDPDESYGGVRTSDILERRLGRVPSGVAYLAVGAAIDRNQTSGFGAEPGRLGDLLQDAGVHRAVVANADAAEGFVSDEPPPDGAFARGAATALMGADGIVPGGTVGRGLLADDPLAPFGRRLDHGAVLAAFDAEWVAGQRSVVLVEASDLSRAAAYSRRATPEQASRLRRDAMASSDDLLAALVERVDPANDALLVVAPVAPSGAPELAVALLQAPGVDGGLLRSPTTRRDGYIQLADLAPSVLALLGEDQPSEIEGRAIEVRPATRSERVGDLADSARRAELRDDLMPVIVPIVIGALAVLLAATAVARRRGRSWGRALAISALTGLAVVPATFAVSRAAEVVDTIWAFVLGVAVVAAAGGLALWLAVRRRPDVGALVGTGAIVLLFVADVLAGARLQVNAVFGYSVAVAGRFAGLGNLAFALFGAATVVLAALLVERYGRRGLPWAFGLLAAVVLIEGLPMLGADVGGVLSMVPAFGVTGMLLAGRRIGLREGTSLALGAVAAVLAFAFVDAARPDGSQTHLARLAEHLVEGRWGQFSDSLTRRLQASFGGAELAAWAGVVALGLAVAAYVVLAARGRIDPPPPPGVARPPRTAAVAGLLVLATVGLVANDSSIAVPATMLIVVVPVAVLRAIAEPDVARSVDMGRA
jgi:hypothetical protein